MNYIQLIFAFFGGSYFLVAIITHIFKIKTHYLVKLCRFGKLANKGDISHMKSNGDIPKSYFKHFYLVAVLFYSYLLYLSTCVYIFKQEVPQWFFILLRTIIGKESSVSVPIAKIYIGVVLMTFQVCRRFYEAYFVSVFAKNGKISFEGYIIGIVHYPACGFAIISGSPVFMNKIPLRMDKNVDFTVIDVFAIILFIWAWWHQHVTTEILANLRKNEKGDIITEKHKLPQGDWFQYLSAPHQTAEILMYFSLTILLWPNITWCYAFLWTLCNQVIAILLAHWWYTDTFEKFPKERKALIPFLY